MIRLHIISIFVFLSLCAFSAPKLVTATCFGGSGDDRIHAVAYAPDGTLVVAGYTNSAVWNMPAGASTYVLGTDSVDSPDVIDGDLQNDYTIFLARFSNDGKQLLSYTRFANQSVKYELMAGQRYVRIAVSDDGIYMTAYGRRSLRDIPGFDGKLDNIPGSKPFIVRFSLDGSHLLNGTYLGGSDGDREINDVDLFPNGDICVNSDLGPNVWEGKIWRLKPDLSAAVWTKRFPVWGGEARLNSLAVTPDGEKVYVGGYGMWSTQFEPYKDPFLFMFDGKDGTQYWKRGTDEKDYGVYNFKQDSIGLNRLISDSQVYGLATDKNGNALVAAYSDGGATSLIKDPWWGGYYSVEGPGLPASIQDGDSFAGFGGVTSAGTVGRMDQTGHWIRSHRFKPPQIGNRIKGICATSDDKVYLVGGGSGIPGINNWTADQSGSGVILKMDMNAAGGNRTFASHLVGMDDLYAISRDRTSYRYAAVGVVKTYTGIVYTQNALQSTYNGGDRDGYLLVFDDNEQVSSTAFDVNTNADADVKFGTETNKNYGSDPYVFTKRRDARPNETSKAYYRFDLSGITEPILRAKFQVYKPNKYSKGYLTIYALKEGNEAWAENTITWNNAPGNLIASPSYMDMTKVDSLGRWEIKNAQVPQIESYETEAFSQYIENARLNGDKSVTLVITSYSPTEQDKAALQASSKEDTTAPIKPRIQIEYAPKASVLTEILFYPNALTLSVGESKKLQAIAVDQYGAQLPTTVSWSVDNEGDLSDTGLFTATKNGIFTVTASSGNVSKQMTITVNSIVNSFAKPIVEDIPTLIVQHKNMQVFWDNHANFNISIFNLVGQLQLNKVANSECFTEQLTLSNGVYLVHLSKGNHKIASKIIVK